MSAGQRSSYLVAQALGLGWMLVAPATALWTWPFAWRRGLLATGLFGAAVEIHAWGLLLLPAALVPLWMGARRYRSRLPFVLGSVGVLALLAHRILDIAAPFGAPRDISGLVGAGLLLAGLVLNAVALSKWAWRGGRDARLAHAQI